MNRKKFILSVFVAIFLIASGLASITLASGTAANTGSPVSTTTTSIVKQISPASTSTATGSSSSTGNVSSSWNHGGTNQVSGFNSTSSLIANATAQGVPLKDLYVPALHAGVANVHNGVVTPGYSQGPAPFGIGAYGIKNVSGSLQSYSYLTNGFQTNLNVTNITAYDINSFEPNGYTVQLNTILNGTTVFGISNFTYWTQNVAFFDSYAHQFEMVDNIWNFSSPSSSMPSSTIYSHTAAQQPYSGAYIGVGPLINNVSAPYNLTLTLESALINGMATVYFNYSLQFTNTSTGLMNTIGGVFDEVQFNSLSGVQGYSAPMPMFRVDGSQYNPTGFIPYDAEVTIEGPGGGSNAMFASVAGNLTLDYNNTTGQYVNVPSAYNIGSETGETSTGIAESWSPSGLVRLSSGPSMIYGMWNVSKDTGTTHFTGTLAPSNAFMFVAPGNSISIGPTTDAQYGYVPMTTSGNYSFYLPSGTYYQEVMLSNYNIEQGALSSSETITLTANMSMGVYTPLYAMNNAQLANISSSGSGTLASPYLAYNNQMNYINPLFGMFSDYGFPVFSGVMIEHTNAYIDFNNTPSFQIMFQQSQSLLYMGALYGMGAIDYLNFAFYDTSNLSVYNASLISGTQPWSAETGIFPYTGSIILWNSTNDLIANSTFLLGLWMPVNAAIFMYNPSNVIANNTIVGNNFEDEFFDTGMVIASSGNLIYNNIFNMVSTFYTENVYVWSSDPWTGNAATYVNTWNVAPTPTSSFYLHVNGYNLSGNVLGLSTMGGNWWNTSPYSGDLAPLTLTGPYYPVMFMQMGLNAGQSWSVTMGGVTHSSTSSVIMFWALPGRTYNFQVSANSGSLVSLYGSTSGSVYVSIGGLTMYGIYYTPVYTFTVTETGLPYGFMWGADLNDRGNNVFNITQYSNTVSMMYAPGEFISTNQAVGDYYGFNDGSIYSGNEYLIPFFQNTSITETFNPIIVPLNLSLSGLPETSTWTVTLYNYYNTGSPVLFGTFTGTGTYIVLPATLGEYLVDISAPGYTLANYNPETINFDPGSTTFYFTMTPAIPVAFTFTGLPSGTSVLMYLYDDSNGYFGYSDWGAIVSTTSGSVTVMVPTRTNDLYYFVESGNPQYTAPSMNTYYGGVDVNIPSGSTSYSVSVPFVKVLPSVSTVTFNESGLSSGSWQVTLNGQSKTASAGSAISFTVAPGTYSYQVSSPGMVSPQSSGTVNVQNSAQSVSVSFAPQTYSVTFIVAGLPANQTLNVTFNGQTQTTSGPGVVFNTTSGTYTYSVGSVNGYTLASNTSSVSVNHNTVVVLSFTPAKTGAGALLYLTYAGFVGLGALAGVLGAVFIPKALGGRKGGE